MIKKGEFFEDSGRTYLVELGFPVIYAKKDGYPVCFGNLELSIITKPIDLVTKRVFEEKGSLDTRTDMCILASKLIHKRVIKPPRNILRPEEKTSIFARSNERIHVPDIFSFSYSKPDLFLANNFWIGLYTENFRKSFGKTLEKLLSRWLSEPDSQIKTSGIGYRLSNWLYTSLHETNGLDGFGRYLQTVVRAKEDLITIKYNAPNSYDSCVHFCYTSKPHNLQFDEGVKATIYRDTHGDVDIGRTCDDYANKDMSNLRRQRRLILQEFSSARLNEEGYSVPAENAEITTEG